MLNLTESRWFTHLFVTLAMDVLCSLRQLGKQTQDMIQELLRITVLTRLPIPVLRNNLSRDLFEV